MSVRVEYFAVNQTGLSTSFRVSGKLGEIAKHFPQHWMAEEFCRALNRAYRLGHRHGEEELLDGVFVQTRVSETQQNEKEPDTPSPSPQEGA